MTVALRAATAADADAVASIWYSGWGDGHLGHVPEELVAIRTKESFWERVPSRIGDTTVAVVGDDVAGFVMVVDDEVEQVYVSGDHRGSGVAGTLIAEAERQVKSNGSRRSLARGGDRQRPRPPLLRTQRLDRRRRLRLPGDHRRRPDPGALPPLRQDRSVQLVWLLRSISPCSWEQGSPCSNRSSWRRPSRRLILTGVATVAVASIAGGVAYSAGRGGSAAGHPDVDAPVREAGHQHRRTASAVAQLLRRSARQRQLRRGQQLRQGSEVGRGRRQALAGHPHHTRGTKAILLDVDDTALATWNYEIASNWAFNPATNGTFVTEQRFPAVPGMVDLVKSAEREGYAIFFLTGRGAAQEAATLGNLTADGVGIDAGYPKPTGLRGRRGRPVHQAGGRGLPGVPEEGVRGRPERLLHHDPLQVGHPGSHRVPRLRHRRQLRRPVQRPQGRVRRPHLQAPQPELLPALILLSGGGRRQDGLEVRRAGSERTRSGRCAIDGSAS